MAKEPVVGPKNFNKNHNFAKAEDDPSELGGRKLFSYQLALTMNSLSSLSNLSRALAQAIISAC